MSRPSLLLASLLVLVQIIPLHAAPPAAPKKSEAVPVDCFGDPLPPGAVARLGTIRLRDSCCVAFSPDDRLLATGGSKCIHLWETATGKQVCRLTVPAALRSIHTLTFSPDGRKIAAFDQCGLHLAVWNVNKTSPLFCIRAPHTGLTLSLAHVRITFSPDGKTILAGNDQIACSWDAATGRQTGCVTHSDNGFPPRDVLVFSPSGKLFATASRNKSSVEIWDQQTGRLLHELPKVSKGFWSLAFSPDDALLATAGEDAGVRIWDVKGGKSVFTLDGQEAPVLAVAFTTDGKGLATASCPHDSSTAGRPTLRLWDLGAGSARLRRKITAPGIGALEYSHDGKTLAWIGFECCVHLLDTNTGTERLPFAGHEGMIRSVAYGPEGRLIATGSDDQTIRLWDVATGVQKGVLHGHTGPAYSLAFSPNGKWLASASPDKTASLWNVKVQKRQFVWKDNGHQLRAVTFTPDGKTLVLGGDEWTLRLVDVRTGLEQRRFQGRITSEYQFCYSPGLAVSPDGRLLAQGGEAEESIRLRELPTGKPLRSLNEERTIHCLAFSPDGRTLTGGCFQQIILWEQATGKERARLQGPWTHCQSVVFSPDGRHLAAAFNDERFGPGQFVRVVELASGRQLGTLAGHEGPIDSVAFSPDGRQLATASCDGTTLIWDLAEVAQRGPHPILANWPARKALTAGDLEAAWTGLAGADAVKAQQMIWSLAAAPRLAVPFLGKRLQPATSPTADQVATLIANLDSDHFEEREKASSALARLGSLAEPQLCKKLADRTSPETRRRISVLLAKLRVLKTLSGDELREVRAVEALEQMGTPEAMRLLRTLAEGAEGARLTREAKASLARRDRRAKP